MNSEDIKTYGNLFTYLKLNGEFEQDTGIGKYKVGSFVRVIGKEELRNSGDYFYHDLKHESVAIICEGKNPRYDFYTLVGVSRTNNLVSHVLKEEHFLGWVDSKSILDEEIYFKNFYI